jgi:hypothetical protein
MTRLFKKLICYFRGHKQGKMVDLRQETNGVFKDYACPRCKARWSRKVKAA